MKKFLHLDLFSGIGGFALAVDRVWPNSTHIFCDNDLFCQEVLKKHWPNSKIYGDIRSITTNTTSDRFAGGGSATTVQEGHQEESEQSGQLAWGFERPYILTGGFPCQPFSQAGRRRGTSDARWLWPEMFRVVQLTKPQFVLAENVRGLVNWQGGVAFRQVLSDWESEGYLTQTFIIPAVAVNAPHRRDRIWFVAHRKYDGKFRTETTSENCSLQPKSTARQKLPINESSGASCLRGEKTRWDNASDTKCERYYGGGENIR